MNNDTVPLPEPRSNRPITIAHRIEYALICGLFIFFRIIGVDAASAIAGKTMRIFGPLIRPVSKRGEDNLKMIFPDLSLIHI